MNAWALASKAAVRHGRGIAFAPIMSICACGTEPVARDGAVERAEAAQREPTTTRVYYTELTAGVVTHSASWDQQPEVSYFATDLGVGQIEVPAERISPVLQRDLDGPGSLVDPDELVTIIVTFREDQKLPRFPEPVMSHSRDTMVNVAVRQEADRLARGLIQARAHGFERVLDEMRSKHAVVEVARFWLINALTLRLPLRAVSRLLDRSDVQYVQYDQDNAPPPQAGVVREGRTLLNSDLLRTSAGWFGLVDSGVRKTHHLSIALFESISGETASTGPQTTAQPVRT